MNSNFKILPHQLLQTYLQNINSKNVEQEFNNLKESKLSTASFSFYTSVSAIASSKIEGEKLEIDSYVKHKMLNIEYQKDLIEKPNDLYNAYSFAQQNVLAKANFSKAHCILSNSLLPKAKQGKCRKVEMLVLEHNTFNIQYTPASASDVEELYNNLWEDIEQLITQKLSITEVFFYASLLHLVFVNIHPFEDGNGRSARLLEKWFVASKLHSNAWFIQSELNYYQNIDSYYKNLNMLGLFYENLNYEKSISFLLMLPQSLSLYNQ